MDTRIVIITSIVAVFLAVVTASPGVQSKTPLYTIRMEQASSNMHFLPTEVNEITYTTTQGYTLTCDIPTWKSNSTEPGSTYWVTHDCTCWGTMHCTCWLTVDCTCWHTLNCTCWDTGYCTCSPFTCWYFSCFDFSCWISC